MDLDPTKWGGLELGLKICPVKTSTGNVCTDPFRQDRPGMRVAASAPHDHVRDCNLCAG